MMPGLDTADDAAMVLPPLRRDLRLARGAPDTDGTPMWTLFDPLRNQYFHLHLAGLRLIRLWQGGRTAGELAEQVREQGMTVSAEEVVGMVRFMEANNLLLARGARDTARLAEQKARTRTSVFQWVLHHYLFFRIPLVHPDAALDRWLPWARRLVSRPMRWLFGIVAAAAFVLVTRQWDSLTGTFLHFLSWEGVLWYALALMFVKSAHELGHAFTAKHYGCHVPAMGIAFLVLMPMLYTDATDTWRLSRDRQRLVVSLAGVSTELIIAVVATFIWGILPDGGLRNAAFFLATISWITSLLINLSPFMRFDGYHVLSDIWGIRNLQPRSFAVTRWRMREALFGFDAPPPESFTPRRRRLMMIYAVGCWTYRFFLFLGIAVLVYQFVFKALGVVLFCTEITWFILRPVCNEMREVSRHRFRFNRQLVCTLLVFGGLCLLFFLPWRGTLTLPAVMDAGEHASIHAPEAARIRQVTIHPGDTVAAGQTLLVLDNPDLALEQRKARRKIKVIRARLDRRAGSARDLADEAVLRSRLAKLDTRIKGLKKRRQALVLKAPFAGRIVSRADLHVGQYVSPDTKLAYLVAPGQLRVRAYVNEDDIARIRQGAHARFIADDGDHPAVDLTVVRIQNVGTKRLSNPVLADIHGGELPVVPGSDRDGRNPELTEGVYRVLLEPVHTGSAPNRRVAGKAAVRVPAESIAGQLFRHVVSVFIRESGF